MRKTILPGIGAFVALVATWGVGVAMASPADSVDITTYSDAKVNAMLDAGWYGDPTDGDDERLYSPDTCRVIDATDLPASVVEHLRDQGFSARNNDGQEALYAHAC